LITSFHIKINIQYARFAHKMLFAWRWSACACE
jgi:hypothetical protein